MRSLRRSNLTTNMAASTTDSGTSDTSLGSFSLNRVQRTSEVTVGVSTRHRKANGKCTNERTAADGGAACPTTRCPWTLCRHSLLALSADNTLDGQRTRTDTLPTIGHGHSSAPSLYARARTRVPFTPAADSAANSENYSNFFFYVPFFHRSLTHPSLSLPVPPETFSSFAYAPPFPQHTLYYVSDQFVHFFYFLQLKMFILSLRRDFTRSYNI